MGPETLSSAPTWPLTVMHEMGDFSPLLSILTTFPMSNINTHYWSTRGCLWTMGCAATIWGIGVHGLSYDHILCQIVKAVYPAPGVFMGPVIFHKTHGYQTSITQIIICYGRAISASWKWCWTIYLAPNIQFLSILVESSRMADQGRRC